MRRQPLRLAVLEATRILEDAGVESPRTDAELLAAHVLGVERTELPLVPLVDPQVVDALGQLVTQRAKRIPLQHITGWAAIGAITVDVGPGVFVPRPETDLLLSWGLDLLSAREFPVVVDLCTGSGALALAVAHARPDAQVYAVDNDTTALAWARRNADARASAGDNPIRLYSGDITDGRLFVELDGLVDLVLCNPPYVSRNKTLPPEVADHDPGHAVFADDGGLALIKSAVSLAARLLKPGGGVAIEHDDDHAQPVTTLLSQRKVLSEIADHTDLAGRPRFVTARRTG
ncbi:peptide chain release factor N(5)-glutamine methyltransferase [Haloechinothrix sp. LS1_15]|uniref:peptide chain release factor N(5)-glutamine methyltransferase n=1 Tax=Haloechinothrix sp. LS1_15 TaxID=2652248 RepID=UPI002946609E|nr:peptide chain release factor N(5)-glutamine methyltransferase [Haloechinothrix sp. LS1_15]MDV6011778.1 peptide chain release factor N(5)-glutamine methyltransferase [Haloechinothrix sp. LS1_15]